MTAHPRNYWKIPKGSVRHKESKPSTVKKKKQNIGENVRAGLGCMSHSWVLEYRVASSQMLIETSLSFCTRKRLSGQSMNGY